MGTTTLRKNVENFPEFQATTLRKNVENFPEFQVLRNQKKITRNLTSINLKSGFNTTGINYNSESQSNCQ